MPAPKSIKKVHGMGNLLGELPWDEDAKPLSSVEVENIYNAIETLDQVKKDLTDSFNLRLVAFHRREYQIASKETS